MAAQFPEILGWVCTSYGAPSHLLYAGIILASESGFQQGDPLASLLFSLVLHPLVLRIQELVPTLSLNWWFHEDGTEVGTREKLQVVVDVLVREGPISGLHLSTELTSPKSKSQVWSPLFQDGEQDPLQRGNPRLWGLGVVLLGAPLVFQSFVREELAAKV